MFSGRVSCGARAGCWANASLAATATTAISGRLIQNTHRHPTEPVSSAPSAGPIRAETPHIAAFRPKARGRRASGMYSANSPTGTANMNPAPRPSTARETASTGMFGASPPMMFATVNSVQATAKLGAAPRRSMIPPAIGSVITMVTMTAPTANAIRSTPPMSWAALGSAVTTISASSDPRNVAPSAAIISAR